MNLELVDSRKARRLDRRRLAAALLVFALLSLAACEESSNPTSPPTGPPTGRVLPVGFRGQQTAVWCWAASIEMVSDYYLRPIEQCQILSAYLNGNCCFFPQACVIAAPSMTTIQQGLLAVSGLSSFHTPGPISFEDLYREIDAGGPVILGYRASFSGHVVVVYGYTPSGTLYIHDPFYGSFQVQYAQTFTYNGQLFWSDTILGIRP